jgi:fatty-acid desaturase
MKRKQAIWWFSTRLRHHCICATVLSFPQHPRTIFSFFVSHRVWIQQRRRRQKTSFTSTTPLQSTRTGVQAGGRYQNQTIFTKFFTG